MFIDNSDVGASVLAAIVNLNKAEKLAYSTLLNYGYKDKGHIKLADFLIALFLNFCA
jgi:hypothetical protein